ncbi:hypothetical protein V6Z12_A07G177100 [Gossypium hirsutum]
MTKTHIAAPAIWELVNTHQTLLSLTQKGKLPNTPYSQSTNIWNSNTTIFYTARLQLLLAEMRVSISQLVYAEIQVVYLLPFYIAFNLKCMKIFLAGGLIQQGKERVTY